MTRVFIVAAKRTPFGAFGGALKGLSATDLAVKATAAALAAGNVKPESVGSVCVGNVQQTSPDAAYLARHVALKTGMPIETPALIINRFATRPHATPPTCRPHATCMPLACHLHPSPRIPSHPLGSPAWPWRPPPDRLRGVLDLVDLGLHRKAWGCPRHSGGEARRLRSQREAVVLEPRQAKVTDFAVC